MDVKLVALGIEKLGLDEFLDGKYFDGPIYLDLDRKVYGAMGASRASAFSVLKPSTWKDGARATKKGFSGNVRGDGLQLGGLLVLEPDGTVVYKFVQEGFGDHPPPADVLRAAASGRNGAPPLSDAEARAEPAASVDEGRIRAAGAEIDRLVAGSKAHVFAHSRCPYSARAKRVFGEMLRTPFTFTDLDLMADGGGRAMMAALRERTGQETIPWVFVEGKFVGGGDDTMALFTAGKLDHLIPPAPKK